MKNNKSELKYWKINFSLTLLVVSFFWARGFILDFFVLPIEKELQKISSETTSKTEDLKKQVKFYVEASESRVKVLKEVQAEGMKSGVSQYIPRGQKTVRAEYFGAIFTEDTQTLQSEHSINYYSSSLNTFGVRVAESDIYIATPGGSGENMAKQWHARIFNDVDATGRKGSSFFLETKENPAMNPEQNNTLQQGVYFKSLFVSHKDRI